jgi:hypothetical protein
MNTLRQSIEGYLAMRRSLGFKLREAGTMLPDFATFMPPFALFPKGATGWRNRG